MMLIISNEFDIEYLEFLFYFGNISCFHTSFHTSYIYEGVTLKTFFS